MDQLKIGKFIAECRKEKKLTQLQLADKLGITDKAVSKWERGMAMPDSSIMLDVCEILGINVNELLSGEKINMEEQSKKAEELLLEFKRKEEKLRKKLYVNAWWVLITSSIFLFIVATLSAIAFSSYRTVSIITMIMAYVIYAIITIIIFKMEFDAGPFVCQKCQHEFVPKIKEALFPIGTPRNYKIRAKCPHCAKKVWAKKIFPK